MKTKQLDSIFGDDIKSVKDLKAFLKKKKKVSATG